MGLREISTTRAAEWRRNQSDALAFNPPSRAFTFVGSIEGLDINRFQRGEILDAAQIAASGRKFVILECTWGMWQPPSFSEFWPPLLDAGIMLLAYGFLCGDMPGADQAELLLETVRPMYEAQGFSMPLFADIEPFAGDMATINERRKCWLDWSATIRKSVKPGVYSNVPSWQTLMNNFVLSTDVIGWRAHYTSSSSPLTPVGWSSAQSPLHQYGIAKKYPWCMDPVPGMKSDVDLDRFYGSLDELRSLGSGAIVITPVEPPVVIDTGDDEMPTIFENISLAKALHTQLGNLLALIELQIKEVPAVVPPVVPPVSTNITIVITDDPKANTRFAKRLNDKGKPVMEIYPGDNSAISERVQFAKGTLLLAKPEKVVADGGGKYFELTGYAGKNGVVLYIRDQDAAKAVIDV